MMSIPDELLDAARIDGANEFRIFWRVVLPLCVPGAGGHGDLHLPGRLGGLLLAADHHVTTPTSTRPRWVSALFVVQNRTSWNVLFAGSVIATLPMIMVFIIFQRKFIQGIALTGVKG